MERNEEKALLNYRFPPPRWVSFLLFVFLAIIVILLTIVWAIIWFFRWIGRAFIANLNVITYIIPMVLAYFVALSLVFLFFIALYL